MSTMNRLANASNKYQTGAKRVLCLCSAGLLRSPTTANVLHQKFGFNTRAAGVAKEYALIPVDDILLEWADEIVCVSEDTAIELKILFDGEEFPPIIVLDIPDQFEWNDPKLREIILEQYSKQLTQKGN